MHMFCYVLQTNAFVSQVKSSLSVTCILNTAFIQYTSSNHRLESANQNTLEELLFKDNNAYLVYKRNWKPKDHFNESVIENWHYF